MADKVGSLIKEARTLAGLTQEALAKKIKGVSANDISLAERGEKQLTQAVLKEIAKVTGVTQKSLLDAAKEGKKTPASSGKKSASSSTGKKNTSSSTGKKTASSSAGKKTASSSAGKKTSSASSFQVSAEEKKLIQAYRGADDKVKAAVKVMLLGTEGVSSASGLGSLAGAGTGDMLTSLLGTVKNLLG